MNPKHLDEVADSFSQLAIMPPMALSTPASPTPETGDGDDLLLELRAFLASASGNSYGSIAMLHRNSDTALRLLRRLPAAKEGKLLQLKN